MTLAKFQDIELYQNTFPTTLRELTEVNKVADDGKSTLDVTHQTKD